MTSLKFLFLILISSFIWSTGFSQITIQNTLNPVEIVEDILLGSGVTVSNIQWNGSTVDASTVQTAIGVFGGTPNIGIPNGVILSCGNVAEAVGPNAGAAASNNAGITDYTTDPDLISLQPSGVQVHDGAVLEFDFVPSGDSISFQYVFGSEEYPEYAPPNSSSFNDAFGFFLTGSIPGGGNYTSQNIALLPNNVTIVSINNINPVTNQAFYVDNAGGTNIEYDGYTTTLRARAGVVCGETYHIKLAISDAGDNQLNSAVFLEANSFSSNAIEVAIVTQTGDTSIIEGCANADIHFIRPESDTLDTLIIMYTITGTAINGTDYTQLGTSSTFFPGEDSVTITFEPLSDAITEPPETVIITVFTLNPCGDTITSVGILWILEPYSEVSVTDSVLPCPNNSGIWLVATPIAGVAPYNFTWPNGSTNDSLLINTNGSGTIEYIVTMTDACNEPSVDTATITINEYNAAAFTASPETGENPLYVTFDNTSTTAGVVSYEWEFGNGLSDQTTTPISVNTTYTEIGDFTVLLTVTNDQGCIDTTTKVITVYDLPMVTAPNVFTPNGDNTNDVFEFFDYRSITSFECVIVNRWGNVVHIMDDITDTWNGMTQDGAAARGGVYFYSYKASSASGNKIDGHGFMHLIRD
ncbi:MAG: hypothetical protein COA38_16655 [Fluviicola sp.]|nr:MAG: hypothetical protein COA38_16655 [Fluviicola sp.]